MAPQAAAVSGHRAGKAVILLGIASTLNEGGGNSKNLHLHCVCRKPHLSMKTSTYIVTEDLARLLGRGEQGSPRWQESLPQRKEGLQEEAA